MNKYNLDVPIYLNQKIVFDLLASINNGLDQVTKLKTSSNVDAGISGGLETELGNKNIFTLLGVNLKGKLEGGKNQEQEQEKVHTPASLFNCLKSELFKQRMVKKVNTEKEFKDLQSGDFVEVNGKLKKGYAKKGWTRDSEIMIEELYEYLLDEYDNVSLKNEMQKLRETIEDSQYKKVLIWNCIRE